MSFCSSLKKENEALDCGMSLGSVMHITLVGDRSSAIKQDTLQPFPRRPKVAACVLKHCHQPPTGKLMGSISTLNGKRQTMNGPKQQDSTLLTQAFKLMSDS